LKNWGWFCRRWFDFRMGHGTYFSLFLSFTNFLLITYTFLVKEIPLLQTLFPSLLNFTFFGAIIYIPWATYVGHLHNTRQLQTDITVQADKNPYYQKILSELEEIKQKLDFDESKKHSVNG
jgi:hypothetical protein